MQMAIERVRVIVKVYAHLKHTGTKTLSIVRNEFEALLHQPCFIEKFIDVGAPLRKEDYKEDSKTQRTVPTNQSIKTRSIKIIEAAHNTERFSIIK